MFLFGLQVQKFYHLPKQKSNNRFFNVLASANKYFVCTMQKTKLLFLLLQESMQQDW
jgi:hypothetical protein